MKNAFSRFGLVALALGLLFPFTVNAANDLEASLVPSVSLVSVGEDNIPLLALGLTNRSPQILDIRRIAFANSGSLSLATALDDLKLYSKGGLISTRFRVYENWDEISKTLTESEVQFWLDSLKLGPGETINIDMRGDVVAGVEGMDFVFELDSVSVKLGETTFIRDLSIDISNKPSSIEIVKGDAAAYSPIVVERDSTYYKPDLFLEDFRFEEVYGYEKNVVVFPICNNGNGPTPADTRIEGSIFAPNNYIRDFILKKRLAAGKCFEQVLSAKRDLRLNDGGNVRLRVELDLQNAIEEERENNNSLSQSVLVPDAISTNNQTLAEETSQSVRRRVLGMLRSRPNAARNRPSETSSFRGFSSRGVRYQTYERVQEEETQEEEEDYTIHPDYGKETNMIRTGRNIYQSPTNDIVREELLETPEEVWEETQWEREPYIRRYQGPSIRSFKRVAEPTVEQQNKPTFREPNAVQRRYTSYRGLRSGVRPNVDFTGQRSNNDPEFAISGGLEVFCRDSDGINIFEKGTVEYKSRRMPTQKEVTDETRGEYVLEYYCEDDYMRRRLFKCEEGGAGDGMCIE